MRTVVALLASLVAVSSAARAQEACDPEGADGGVDAFGTCEGDLLRYCAGGVVEEWDCSHEATPDDAADDYWGPEIESVCALVDDAYGYDCAVVPSGPCLFDVDGQVTQAHCAGAAPGCLVDLAGEGRTLCVEDAPACAPDGAAACDGDRSIVACRNTQPLIVDCASGGGTCGADGACAFPDAGPGDPAPEPPPCGACPAGTRCDAASATCVEVPQDDDARDDVAGAVDDPATDDDGDRPERRGLFSCVAQDATGVAPLVAIAAFAALGLRRVRRR